jgi:hypothetical protein
MRRALLAGALALGIVLGSSSLMSLSNGIDNVAVAAPAAQTGDFRISTLRFATAVRGEFDPVDPRVEFPSGTDAVWVIFEYVNYRGGTLSFVARANETDHAWGNLRCCQYPERRFGFQISHRGEHFADQPSWASQPGIMSALGLFSAPANLPGAAYAVFIYLNDTEVGSGGFGIRGVQGLDNGNDNEVQSNH